jgi:hypothetical protein
MYEQALAGGSGEVLANGEADLSHKKATFQYKLAKAWAKHQKKEGFKAAEQPPPEVHDPAAIQVVDIGTACRMPREPNIRKRSKRLTNEFWVIVYSKVFAD